ncbi:MAG: sigma-70 family RNA polymerase sigma factor [Phycisphaerae bacterium]
MIKETDVIHQVLNGDVDSFRLLVQRYQRPVISMIKNIINDQHMCEDVAQDVFLTAYKKLDSFDPARSNFSTWLFTIAKNKSLNVLKKKRALSMSQLPEKTDSRNPSDELGEKELFDELDRILQTLPVRQKTAFVLAEFEKLPYAEIAQIEGVRIGTIKSRINRAKRKLSSALENLDGDIL